MLSLALSLLLTGGSFTGPVPANPAPQEKNPAQTLSDEEQGVLDQTNTERKKANLPPLKASPKLFQAARQHAANMAKQQNLSHDLDNKTFDQRLKALGYIFQSCGENIAQGQRTPQGVLKSWMESDGHRGNILNAEFTEIGIGMAVDSQGYNYWTQVFGKPLKR